jgi:hypothetical protein
MESKKNEPESIDADMRERGGGETAESDAGAAIPVVEQIDDSELLQSIKDQFRKTEEPEPE